MGRAACSRSRPRPSPLVGKIIHVYNPQARGHLSTWTMSGTGYPMTGRGRQLVDLHGPGHDRIPHHQIRRPQHLRPEHLLDGPNGLVTAGADAFNVADFAGGNELWIIIDPSGPATAPPDILTQAPKVVHILNPWPPDGARDGPARRREEDHADRVRPCGLVHGLSSSTPAISWPVSRRSPTTPTAYGQWRRWGPHTPTTWPPSSPSKGNHALAGHGTSTSWLRDLVQRRRAAPAATRWPPWCTTSAEAHRRFRLRQPRGHRLARAWSSRDLGPDNKPARYGTGHPPSPTVSTIGSTPTQPRPGLRNATKPAWTSP